MSEPHESFTIRIVRKFLESNLSLVFIIVSIALGALALLVTPREEEPQIIVAAANVLVSFPGHSAQDVEQLVSTPLEKMMLQIPGRRVRVLPLDAGPEHRHGAFLRGAAAGAQLRQDHPQAQRKHGPGDAGRGGMGGEADRRGRRAHRHLHAHERCPGTTIPCGAWRMRSSAACRELRTPVWPMWWAGARVKS